MTYSSTFSSFPQPTASSHLNSPSHSALHNQQSSAIGQLEAVVGLDGASSVLGTVIGDLRSPASGGGGHVQTANKGGTGQTTYTKGDMLVATSSSVLAKLSVGNDNAFLAANSSVAGGVQWKAIPIAPTIRVYGYSPSVITWNKPSVLSYIIVEAVAGGDGGSKVGSAPPGASGGNGGSYAKKVIAASLLGTTETLKVGSAGVGATSNGAGGAGSVSSFGNSSLMTSSSGDIVMPGRAGGTFGVVIGGTQAGGNGGDPGNSSFGKGGVSSMFGGAVNAEGYGAGGKGGDANSAGQSGTAGVVIVYEY